MYVFSFFPLFWIEKPGNWILFPEPQPKRSRCDPLERGVVPNQIGLRTALIAQFRAFGPDR
jgi:hypothetical protein